MFSQCQILVSSVFTENLHEEVMNVVITVLTLSVEAFKLVFKITQKKKKTFTKKQKPNNLKQNIGAWNIYFPI